MRKFLAVCLLLSVCTVNVIGQDNTSASSAKKATNWHQWRGPNSDGSSATANPPTEWSDTENVKWKVPIPGAGSASPIVWENKIFIATAIETDREGDRTTAVNQSQSDQAPARQGGGAPAEPAPTRVYQYVLLCFDRANGQELWRQVATEQVPHEGRHLTNTFASGSPTTDGQLVYVSFGSRGIFCYDLDGNQVWQRDLGDMQTRNGFGEGSSPTLHGDSLVVLWDHEGPSFIEVLDSKTGQTRWKKDRDEVTTWNTPLIAEYEGRTQVITNGTQRSRSYDLATGELIWECGGQFTNPVPSPIRVDDHAICMTGYRGYAIYSIPLSAEGDLTDSDRIKWKRNDAAPYTSSAVLYGGQLYFTKGLTETFSIIDARSGESIVDQVHLPGVSRFYASPVAAMDRIYFTGRDGTTVVLRHGRELDIIATNNLGEDVDASPAIVGDQMFVRGAHHLFCLQQQ